MSSRHRLRLPNADRVKRIVSEVNRGIAAVRAGAPKLLVVDGVAIDVVPAGVDDVSVMEHGRVPLLCLVEGNGAGV